MSNTPLPAPVQAAIGIGGNLGDRRANLRRAIDLLAPQIRLLAVSPLYESAPWGVTDQPAFLNAALLAETALAPHDLLDALKAIEAAVGRRPGKRWGPRVVDLDILLYADRQLHDDRLTIPHVRIAERNFVLRPLADLDPARVPPGWTRSVGQTLAAFGQDGLVQVEDAGWVTRDPS